MFSPFFYARARVRTPQAISTRRRLSPNSTLCTSLSYTLFQPSHRGVMRAWVMRGQELGYPKGQQPPLVLCGDFNTVPDMGLDARYMLPRPPVQPPI